MEISTTKCILVVILVVNLGLMASASCGNHSPNCPEKCIGQYGDDEDVEFCKDYTCPQDKVKCKDGITCIMKDLRCDGVTDCPDGSDEEASFCSTYVCPSHRFQCDGNLRCIHEDKVCNLQNDCFDGSDESPSKCYSCPCNNCPCSNN